MRNLFGRPPATLLPVIRGILLNMLFLAISKGQCRFLGIPCALVVSPRA